MVRVLLSLLFRRQRSKIIQTEKFSLSGSAQAAAAASYSSLLSSVVFGGAKFDWLTKTLDVER